MSRKNDRKHAFCLVFEKDFYEDFDGNDALEYYLAEFEEDGEVDKAFIMKEFGGVSQNLGKIDEYISQTASGWKISRLSKVDLAIMRLAVYEMLFEPDIPNSVSINEAVEFAKTYSTNESGKFINGILGKISALEAAVINNEC